MATASSNRAVTRIRPPTKWAVIDFAELWEYRGLLWTLALRDIQVRYKQSLLGVAWAIIPPLFTMLVFNVLFSILMGSEGRPTIEGIPYAVSTYCALVPWRLFAESVERSGKSLVTNRALITKVYFPRIITPLAPIISALLDFLIALAFLFLLIFGYHLFADYVFVPNWQLLAIPLLTLFALLAALSLSLWCAALNAIYRDVQYTLPFALQILMFVTPVIYPAQTVLQHLPDWAAILYGLNPMAGVTEGFRWILLGSEAPSALLMGASVGMTLVLLVGAVLYFSRMESRFVDVV